MTIAGIKPLGEVKTIYINPINGEPMAVNDVSAGEYYDRARVRDILIDFIHGLETDDLDSIRIMYENGLNNTAKLIETDVVDNFMNN